MKLLILSLSFISYSFADTVTVAQKQMKMINEYGSIVCDKNLPNDSQNWSPASQSSLKIVYTSCKLNSLNAVPREIFNKHPEYLKSYATYASTFCPIPPYDKGFLVTKDGNKSSESAIYYKELNQTTKEKLRNEGYQISKYHASESLSIYFYKTYTECESSVIHTMAVNSSAK